MAKNGETQLGRTYNKRRSVGDDWRRKRQDTHNAKDTKRRLALRTEKWKERKTKTDDARLENGKLKAETQKQKKMWHRAFKPDYYREPEEEEEGGHLKFYPHS